MNMPLLFPPGHWIGGTMVRGLQIRSSTVKGELDGWMQQEEQEQQDSRPCSEDPYSIVSSVTSSFQTVIIFWTLSYGQKVVGFLT